MDPAQREVGDLSVKEMKFVLKAKGVADAEVGGWTRAGWPSSWRSTCCPMTSCRCSWRGAKTWPTPAVPPGAAKEAMTEAMAGGNLSQAQMKEAAEKMQSADPEQLKRQAAMMRSMPKDQLRRMNPQFANFSDQQMEMAIQQTEQMAANPEMMKMAAEQMKNMTPEQLEEMKKMAQGMGGAGAGGMGGMMGGGGGGSGGGGAVTSGGGGGGGGRRRRRRRRSRAAQCANGSVAGDEYGPRAAEEHAGDAEEEPAMLKSMMKMVPGGDKMDEKQLIAQLEAVEKMDPATLQRMMKFGQWGKAKFDAVKPYYDRANAAVGGHLLKILVLLVLFCCYRFIAWLFFGSWLFFPLLLLLLFCAAAAASSFAATRHRSAATRLVRRIHGRRARRGGYGGSRRRGRAGSSGGGSVGGSDDAEDEFD